MSQYYQIGTSQGALVDLLDDPHPIERTTEPLGFTLAGNPLNVAMENIKWTWKNMSQIGWNQIYTFWATNIELANPPGYTYIKTLKSSGNSFEYGIYRCRMSKPIGDVTAVVAEIRDAEVTFVQCELIG